jgi:hypothetical protein
MQEFLEFLLDLITLKSMKRGPLAVAIELKGQDLRLTLTNQGRRPLTYAAVRAGDSRGKQHFPKADLATPTVLHPGRPESLRLSATELRSLDCQRLEILDTTGHAWPVAASHDKPWIGA